MTKLWACVQPCHPLGEPLFRVCPYPEFSLFSPSSPPFPVPAAHACFQSASRMVGTDTGSLTISGNFPPPSNSPAPDSSADKPGVQCGTSGIFPVIGHRALLLHAVLLSPVPTLTLSNKKRGQTHNHSVKNCREKKGIILYRCSGVTHGAKRSGAAALCSTPTTCFPVISFLLVIFFWWLCSATSRLPHLWFCFCVFLSKIPSSQKVPSVFSCCTSPNGQSSG